MKFKFLIFQLKFAFRYSQSGRPNSLEYTIEPDNRLDTEEVISLRPIGTGIRALEPSNETRKLSISPPGSYPVQGLFLKFHKIL